eukprot:1154601-Pelagomonas_calceolata.AAC.2
MSVQDLGQATHPIVHLDTCGCIVSLSAVGEACGVLGQCVYFPSIDVVSVSLPWTLQARFESRQQLQIPKRRLRLQGTLVEGMLSRHAALHAPLDTCGDASQHTCGDASQHTYGDASQHTCGDASQHTCGDASH